MSQSTFILLLLLFLTGSRGQRSSCSRCDLHLSCNCSHGGFTRVPVVTERALTLDLSFNGITVVTGDDLTGHAPLRALSLHGNQVSAVNRSAFDSLRSLERLDLSDNQLTELDHRWFRRLGALQELDLRDNPYRTLVSSCRTPGPSPLFEELLRLRRLRLGGPALQELRRGDLRGVTQLEELHLQADNLQRYESGALAYVWPLGGVTLSLHGPFSTNTSMAAAVLADVSYPETPLVLEDLHLIDKESVQPLAEVGRRRVRSVTLRNVSVSDAAIVNMMVVMDGRPLTYLSVDGATMTGEGRWEPARKSDLKSLDEVKVKDVVVENLFQFTSFITLSFLLQYPRKLSVINVQAYVMPCQASRLLVNLHYLDMSDNLLTDLTLVETLCDGKDTLKDLRVLNVSDNALKSLSTLSRLVSNLSKLTHLDVSGTGYSSMPRRCSWPSTLRHLNISRAKLTSVTTCLPPTLQVLDLSDNNLKSFSLLLPALRELHLSGNKFLRLPLGYAFPNLETLTIQSNTLNMFTRADLQSYPRLQKLQAGQNKFVCSCEFVDFLQLGFAEDAGVAFTDREESYVCDSPLYLQGEPVGRVRLSVLECHRVLLVSASCGAALLLAVVVCVVLWRLHAVWYLEMIWAWLKAKRTSRRRRQRRKNQSDSEPLMSYDAFVSYSERDASWVENFLVPELEEPRDVDGDPSPRPLSLCLHKRDFLPGQWIVDNIMSAMERSRRTVFVLSENFVRSDWCRYELDFSHFWLFDGSSGGDAAILILLEPLAKDDIPKRFCKLRKLMDSTTYLEWPQEEERTGEFWRSLRRALRSEEEEDD